MSSASLAVATADGSRPRSPFKRSFWVANTMEIFERLAWYGFFAVSSLYITGSRSEGALGFTSEQRGVLQGVVPFILYLLPVVFGALGDRFGYKKTFMAAYTVLVPAYFLLGKFTAFGTFFMAFLFVAVGAAIFKPVVVGTVARTTDETNSSMGFGIFYMMVNIGGFIGPLVAGYVRVRYGWDMVFVASAFWIACNFIWLFVFYKEPTTEATSAQKRSIKQVLSGIVEVLGNGRFFVMVFGILAMLAISGKFSAAVFGSEITWKGMGIITAVWVAANLLVDIPLRKRQKIKAIAHGFLQPMKLGNWKFGLYLLILSGFWTSFNQIFLTMPEYIRDFVETKDMVHTSRALFGDNFAKWFAAVNEDLLQEQVGQFVSEKANTLDARIRAVQDGSYMASFDTIPNNRPPATINPRSLVISADAAVPFAKYLYDFKVRLSPEELRSQLSSLPIESLPVDPNQGRTMLGVLGSAAAAGQPGDQAISNYLNAYVDARYPHGKGTATTSANHHMTAFSASVVAKLDSARKVLNLDERKMGFLLGGVVFVPPPALKAKAQAMADQYRQVNPEYIINVDALAIVIFQVLVSFIIGRFAPLAVMIVGIFISSVGIGMSAFFVSGWLVILAITIFAFGEMMASPKSQEYVGRIAPQQKVAMYMGFYFWTVALGNIFGGRLSGELYGSLARDAGRPDIMWYIFGGLGLLTAAVLIIYDRAIIGKGKME